MKVVLAGILLASVVLTFSSARNINLDVKPRTHGNFRPKVKHSFEIKPAAQFTENLRTADPIAIAKSYVAVKTNVPVDSIRVSSSHTNARNGVTHVYLQQVANGLDIANAVANVNVDRSGKILSVGSSFYAHAVPASNFGHSIQFSASEAVLSFAKFLKLAIEPSTLKQAHDKVASDKFTVSGAPFALKDIPAELKYIQKDGGSSVVLTWSIVVEMKDNMYNAMIDVNSGEVVSLIDWVADATYNVFPLGINDPESGSRALVKDPAHPVASPGGWHVQGSDDSFTGTIGNNVYAQNNPDGFDDYINNYRPDGSSALNFDFPVDLTKDPEEYVDAAITNLFYWNNIVHDLFYVYGFDEQSGNFQDDNLGRGGQENDAVVAFAQDGSGTNNANFMTPPDGQQGRMRMYVWTASNPRRDGDLDGGIVFHEYLHGISTRLTGGPSDVSCLGYGESGGMGEGWGDFFATITRTTENSTRADVYAMGDYSANDDAGIRNYVYSTDMTVNPSTYAYLGKSGYSGVHAIGEVWAVILYDVFWNVVDKNGFDPNWYNNNASSLSTEPTFRSLRTGQVTEAKPRAALGGNVMMFQNVVDGMKLQPCDPTFIDARDAIIQADELNFGGINKCELWRGFAKRGLGVGAFSAGDWTWEGEESFEVPEECAQH